MSVQQDLALRPLDAAGLATNPFRVLGLDPSVSAGQIRRRAEQAAAIHRLGVARPLDCLVPLPSAPDDHLLRDASHRLRDPMNRLLAEVSWFEPDPGPNPAWHLDRPTPTDTLMKTWTDLCWLPEGTARRPVAAHNAAILQLMLLAQTVADGDPAGSHAAWAEVPRHLAIWLADDSSVRKVVDRAAVLGAAAVDGDLDPWRRELTRALLRPLVDLALVLVEKGVNDAAITLLSLRAPGTDTLPSAGVHLELRRLAWQAEERIVGIIDDAWTRAQAADANAVAVGRGLLADARPWFDVLETAAMDLTSRSRVLALEDVHRLARRLADILAACAINFLDPDDPIDRQRAASTLLEAASRITYDAEQRREVKEVLQTVRQNIAYLNRTGRERTCFQCNAALPTEHPRAGVPFVWPGDAVGQRPDAAVEALGLAPGSAFMLGLPRCRKCHAAARRVYVAGKLLWVLSGLGPVGIFVLLMGLGALISRLTGPFQQLPGHPSHTVSLVVIVLVVLVVLGGPFVKRALIVRAVKRHPSVASLLALGYRLPKAWLDEQFTFESRT